MSQANEQRAASGDAPYSRKDTRRRDIVEHAILVQQSSNTMSAFEYLVAQDIGADVIERVLLDPHRRRVASR